MWENKGLLTFAYGAWYFVMVFIPEYMLLLFCVYHYAHTYIHANKYVSDVVFFFIYTKKKK